MKRFLSLLLTLILAAGCLTACSAGPAPAADKLQIVATIFPEYNWVRAVLGDNPAGVEVTLLLDSGVDLHSYQPTAADILKISGCSAETEASFETVTFLAQQVDALSLHTVLTLEKSDRRIAETIVRNTKSKDQQILALDSLQSTDAGDVKNGGTYREGEYLYCTLRDARLV